jgi:hypothetical protein
VGRARPAVVAAALAVAALGAPARAGDDLPPPPPPDLGFYATRVAPWVDATCASCHRTGGGGFRLGTPAEGEAKGARRAREMAAVARFLDREAPWRSRLVRKVLPEDKDGLPHAGGVLLSPDDEAYDDLLDFASGATTSNLPPEPEPGRDRRAKPGQEVVLDGSLSYDRDEDRLRFRWELFVRPPGSAAGLVADREPIARLVPDVGGTYVVRLRVSDGKVWSAPRPVVLEALDRVGPEAPDPVAASGLEAVSAADLRRVRAVHGAVLGRPPTPPETLAAATKDASTLAATLLSTVEAGRAWLEDEALRLGLVGDFAPASEAAASLPLRLAAGTTSPAEAEATLLRDPAFLAAHAGVPALADALGALVLGRALSPAEREAVLAAGKPAAAVEAVLSKEEARVAALRRFAARYLGSETAASVPASRAAEGTTALALSFVASPAFSAAAPTAPGDAAFVRAVFADLLGRRPSASELAALVRAAAVIPGSSAGRAAIVAVLLDSGEVALPLGVQIQAPDAWVADRFLRYLGRPPTAAEGAAHRRALADPDGGPAVVVRALLTSREYASR